jgi:hypothetical protein
MYKIRVIQINTIFILIYKLFLLIYIFNEVIMDLKNEVTHNFTTLLYYFHGT